ncbi:MAG: toprim domain-containing protein [Candidatus Micrarchaeota archaeon]
MEKLDKLTKIMEKLKDQWIFVEGQKDKKALQDLGFDKILTISGNLKLSCEQLVKKEPMVRKVFVLTDLDRRGHQLAKKAKEELERFSIKADLQLRGDFGYALGIRTFENASKAYEKLKEENENKRR